METKDHVLCLQLEWFELSRYITVWYIYIISGLLKRMQENSMGLSESYVSVCD